MHATVQHQSCPEVDEDEGPNVSPCHAAHMCIHEGPGLETFKMHEALAKKMRRVLPAKSSGRQAFDAGRLFLCVNGYERAEGPASSDGCVPMALTATHWLHVTHPNLTTFRFRVHCMHFGGAIGHGSSRFNCI